MEMYWPVYGLKYTESVYSRPGVSRLRMRMAIGTRRLYGNTIPPNWAPGSILRAESTSARRSAEEAPISGETLMAGGRAVTIFESEFTKRKTCRGHAK